MSPEKTDDGWQLQDLRKAFGSNLAVFLLLLASAVAVAADDDARPRARDTGLVVGTFQTGTPPFDSKFVSISGYRVLKYMSP